MRYNDDDLTGTFTDLLTGEKAYPERDNSGRIHLTRASGNEIGNGFDTEQEMHSYVLTFGLNHSAERR